MQIVEYLLIYGWLLVVIAIVGGAIAATMLQDDPGQVTGELENITGQTCSVTDNPVGDSIKYSCCKNVTVHGHRFQHCQRFEVTAENGSVAAIRPLH